MTCLSTNFFSLFQIVYITLALAAAASAWPRTAPLPAPHQKKCHFLDANPFFQTPERHLETFASKSQAAKQHFKDELVFLTEFSRFMNKKAPELLQVKKLLITNI